MILDPLCSPDRLQQALLRIVIHWHLSIQSKTWSLSQLSSPIPPRQGSVTLSHDNMSRCGVTAAALETELIIMCNTEPHARLNHIFISLSPFFFFWLLNVSLPVQKRLSLHKTPSSIRKLPCSKTSSSPWPIDLSLFASPARNTNLPINLARQETAVPIKHA